MPCTGPLWRIRSPVHSIQIVPRLADESLTTLRTTTGKVSMDVPANTERPYPRMPTFTSSSDMIGASTSGSRIPVGAAASNGA